MKNTPGVHRKGQRRCEHTRCSSGWRDAARLRNGDGCTGYGCAPTTSAGGRTAVGAEAGPGRAGDVSQTQKSAK